MRIPKMILRGCLSAVALAGPVLRPGVALSSESDDAKTHYDAGVRAFEEQRFADAAAEFETAYALKPAWQVLYNMGSVYAALGRPVDAVDAYERYLRAGGSSIAGDRRSEVEGEMVRQREKIGELEIDVNEAHAEVRVDAKLVGFSPLPAPLTLAAGTHSVDVQRDQRRPEHRDVSVVARQRSRILFSLVPVVTSAAKRMDQPRPLPSVAVLEGSSGTVQRIIGFSIGGLGLVGAGVGIAIVAAGQNKHVSAVDEANAGHRTDAERLESDADHQKTLGYATIGIGGAAVLGGVVLLLTAPSGTPARVASRFSPWASASAGGFVYGGTFQ